MKITRSSKCSFKFANSLKLTQLKVVLTEYGRVVNFFINEFFPDPPSKSKLLTDIVNLPNTWLTARLRKVAAREAIDLIRSSVEKDGEDAIKPVHRGKSMHVSSTIASLQQSNTDVFDCWLHLQSIGDGIILDIPIRKHQHFNKLNELGKRLESYIITRNYVQFSFEIETGKKKTEGKLIGIDSGINALASLSDGTQYGTDAKELINKIKRCKHGSRRQKRLRRSLKQQINEVTKQIFDEKQPRLVVVENLKDLGKDSKKKKKLHKSSRKSISVWTYRYWLDKIKRTTEERRSSFRSVYPQYTSQKCSKCGHTDRRNRKCVDFLCGNCGFAANADMNAAKNILSRFLTGPYGASFKPSNLVHT